MADLARQSTGIMALDELLGGGLLPGTLTVVVGATGVGKTQLGIQYAHAGLAAEETLRGPPERVARCAAPSEPPAAAL